MNTLFLLMAQYQGQAVIPVSAVCRDYFSHLTVEKFLRKVGSGEIVIPVIRMEGSQKAMRGVHISDLAKYLDERRSEAQRECELLNF